MHNQPSVSCLIYSDRSELAAAGVGNVPGCYAAFDGETCLYVGRSWTLLKRIMSHWIDQKDGNGRKWRLAGLTEWYFKKSFAPESATLAVWFSDDPVGLELDLIKSLKPTYNGRRYDSIAPLGGQRVIVTELTGMERSGIIVGESRNKSCWRVRLDGNSRSTVYNYHKSRCVMAESTEDTTV